MSKPKKRRTKKYQPGRPKIPTWAYDAWGQLTESDIKRIDDVVNVDLNLIRLGTYDPERYKDILFALKQFYAFSKRFNGSDENELLATMGTAATQCLLGLSEEAYKTGKPAKPSYVEAMFEPLEHALATYSLMMRECYRSEHETARREARRMSLTKAIMEVGNGGCWIVDPKDSTQNGMDNLGKVGIAYVHRRCEIGYLEEDEGAIFWCIPDKQTFIRLEKPTLVLLFEKEPSHARAILNQNK